MTDNKHTDTHGDIGNEALASALGISLEELDQLEWTIDADMGSDTLIYEVIVTFSGDSPKDILEKINGINGDHQARLNPAALKMG